MIKFSKIVILFLILFSLSFGFSFATDTIDNSTTKVIGDDSYNEENMSSDITTDGSSESEQQENNSFILGSSGVTSVSQLSSYSEANLGLNNILNIILIAIGILIILFAIAILIRLKH